MRIDVPEEYLPILDKIATHSKRLKDFYTPTFGLRACSKTAGGFTKQHLILPKEKCRNPVRYIESSDLGDDTIRWKGRWLDYQPDMIYSRPVA